MSRVVPRHIARQVQSRAKFMCEYCKLPDFLGFADFEVDHIIAKAHLGGDQLDNLAWSCLLCNVNKGPNLASIDPRSGKVAKLFHPRRNRWRSHFRFSEGLIIPQTASGRATLFLLKMNSPQTFSVRRALEQTDPLYGRRIVQLCR
jgi:hypothetical protein